ncbi:aldose 1-epimerase family protein [Nocardioides anomalus]|uniref:Aldose 1-epimerase family protein n=1 Tax=Nocardioides anomalus TaxID=2712223 RepID=A0A6G6WDM6_9ACTN|nr:aldose 1-epimerase family protein [Nocardioides anomalus]QIG43451.1 aldose 1-epimerase family protein [Nocardioides anomalus]
MVAPSGEQHEISSGDYRAVVTQSGAALRSLTHEGRDLVDGFGADEMSAGGRGQVLAPWPNRIRDGQYSFAGRDLQLPLTEPARHNASHGLVRWASFAVLEQADDAVRLGYRVPAQSGYPWTLDVSVRYAVGPDGLTVTTRALNQSGSPAPFAAGHHPYLTAGAGPCDAWSLTLTAGTRVLADPERKLPTGTEPVAGTAYDFADGRVIGDLVLDHAFGGWGGSAVLRGPEAAVELWADEAWGWVMVYTGDDNAEGTRRRSVALEPMTAPADAFNSGEGLRVLEPGEAFEAAWGIRRL